MKKKIFSKKIVFFLNGAHLKYSLSNTILVVSSENSYTPKWKITRLSICRYDLKDISLKTWQKKKTHRDLTAVIPISSSNPIPIQIAFILDFNLITTAPTKKNPSNA